MALQSCGASIQACLLRIAVLEQDGVPLPGASNIYATDTISKLDATPVYTKGVDIEVINGCGLPGVVYKAPDVFKRYDLQLTILNLDPEIEFMLVGGEIFTQGGFHVGASSPDVGQIERPYGVSVEVWSKHIVNGSLDPTWPYIRWIFPQTIWSVDRTTLENAHMTRVFNGFTQENQNWFNGPANDWTFASDRTMAWAFTKVLPAATCGATSLTGT